MSSPVDTSKQMQDPWERGEFLLGALTEGPTPAIGRMEQEGQDQMVEASTLPTEIIGQQGQAGFERLGFVFGDVVEDDPLFRFVDLPDGWARRATDHALWTDIVDERGLCRVAVFYKAAFYDRSAHMQIVDVWNRFVADAEYGDGPLDWSKVDLFTAPELDGALHAVRRALERVARLSPVEKQDVEFDAQRSARLREAKEGLLERMQR